VPWYGQRKLLWSGFAPPPAPEPAFTLHSFPAAPARGGPMTAIVSEWRCERVRCGVVACVPGAESNKGTYGAMVERQQEDEVSHLRAGPHAAVVCQQRCRS